MESRPHHPRPRPDHSRPRPPLPRPRPLKSKTEKHHFFTGDIGIYHRRSAFSCLYFHFFPFRSCGLDRVVSSETKTFDPRARDLWETRPRRDRDPGLETSITRAWVHNMWIRILILTIKCWAHSEGFNGGLHIVSGLPSLPENHQQFLAISGHS